jgi:hypothetical protein
MASETVTIQKESQSLEAENMRGHLRDRLNSGLERVETGEQFPGTFALDDATGETFLASGAKQAAMEVAKFAFPVVIGARQISDIVTVK